MIDRHELVNEDGNTVLYVFFNFDYEFGKSFIEKDDDDKNDTKNKIYKYIKEKNIDFKKGLIVLVAGGVLVGSFFLNGINNVATEQKAITNKIVYNNNFNKMINNDSYTVKHGDTIYSIASKYNISVEEIMTINNLKNSNIFIGQVLKLNNNQATTIDTISNNQTIIADTTAPRDQTATNDINTTNDQTTTADTTIPNNQTITTDTTAPNDQTTTTDTTIAKNQVPSNDTIISKNQTTVTDTATPNNQTITNDTIITKDQTASNDSDNTTVPATQAEPEASDIIVTVYRSSGIIQQMKLEEYIIGVVAAEMPASFNIEALKAQAVIARTYAMNKIEKNEILNDNISTQVYIDINQMKNKWGSSFETYFNKIKNAVESTNGECITYNGKYIDAVYYSTSNGYTEDAENVWGKSIPYLKSVASPWDKNASSYLREDIKEFNLLMNILGINFDENTEIKILNRNSSGRVESIMIGTSIYSGIEFRELLGLRSTDFDIDVANGIATITTRGFGHGVGLSQYGANGMANENYKYNQIIKHYYTGVDIVKK